MADIRFRTYAGDRTETGDYAGVHRFLVRNGFPDYTYGRFDWMMTNWEYLEDQYLPRIGLWEDGGTIVGATLFDHTPDVIFPLVQSGYEYLYGDMIQYAAEHMTDEAHPAVLLYANDADAPLRAALKARGFTATQWQEKTAKFDCGSAIPARNLPEGYAFTTLAEEEDLEKYFFCLFQGFDHEANGETFSFSPEQGDIIRAAYHRSCLDLNLKISVRDPAGRYVAHCGMWYDADSAFALIEPVCVIPACRKMGLGREVVYEGLRRVQRMGAKYAVVGSDQPFYTSIGMKPFTGGTLWQRT